MNGGTAGTVGTGRDPSTLDNEAQEPVKEEVETAECGGKDNGDNQHQEAVAKRLFLGRPSNLLRLLQGVADVILKGNGDVHRNIGI